jgi:hypothetical protein
MPISLPPPIELWLKEVEPFYCVEFGERFWFIESLESLEKPTNVNGNVTPSWCQLQSYVKMYREVFDGQEYLLDNKSQEFTFKRLNSCIAIGDDNGDPLFIDPSTNYSVWCLYHDGADIEKLSEDFTQFSNTAKPIHEET